MQRTSHAHQRFAGSALLALAGVACLVLTAPGYAAPFVSAGADVLGLTGGINNESLNVQARSVSQTNSISQTIDPLSASASFTTASGNLLLTPSTPVAAVPEPASTASLLAGLGALALFTARRRRPGVHGRAHRSMR